MSAADMADHILSMTATRGAGKSICPSEVARALWPTGWRAHMEAVRAEAFRLRSEGKVRITQGGVDIATDHPAGPIRITTA